VRCDLVSGPLVAGSVRTVNDVVIHQRNLNCARDETWRRGSRIVAKSARRL
jgi:hypothetical protein